MNLGDLNDVLSILITQQKGSYCSPTGFEFGAPYSDYIINRGVNFDLKLIFLKNLADKMIEFE